MTSWLDWVLLVLLVGSALLGLWRGLVFELLSIAGWLIAYFGAPVLAPLVEAWLPQQRFEAGLLHVLGLSLSFILILLVWSLGAKLVRALLHATPLSVIDRLAGCVFGFLRGLLVCLILAVLVGMTPAKDWSTWQESHLASGLQKVLHEIRPVLPDELLKLIPA
ncbi:CvpA family protein [Roseateles oligotrophus]|uniref:CvpA family protein n=1 Tax=Roseateles oligotrophus TaxID=1769250 RepID=A0ABT2YFF1_9BURK|nr:CvpA family protein [Roseateles oligotrophus]MCV2368772.1 CvpA family protein [Roseateles oligotrophus]